MKDIEVYNGSLSSDTVIEIGKFTILWGLFEKEKCGNDCNVDKLAQIVRNKEDNQHWKALAMVLKSRLDARGCGIDDYVNSYLSHGKGMKEIEKVCVKDFINNNGEKCLVGGLIAVYRIRNNMFHGLKEWICLNEQIKLFKGINEFLTEALNFL